MRRKKKSSSLSIKIKPFTKPPTLPVNFYPSSSAVLFSSLHAILHRQSTLSLSLSGFGLLNGRDSPTSSTTTTTSTNYTGGNNEMPSREELYGKVQDLCTHGFGPKLYYELIQVLDQAAFHCASRLTEYGYQPVTVTTTDTGDTGDVSFTHPTMNCTHDTTIGTENNQQGRIYFKSMAEERPAAEGSTILEHVWTVYSDYIQFLNCVRNIFLSLDRMFLYLPPNNTKTGSGCGEGRVLSRNASGSGSGTGTGSASNSGNANSGAKGKQSSEEHMDDSRFVDLNATAGAAWDMWDVGMNCVYKHFAMIGSYTNTAPSKAVSTSAFASASTSAFASTSSIAVTDIDSSAATMNTMNTMDYSSMDETETGTGTERGKYSILQTLKVRTVQCIIAELDLLSSSGNAGSGNGDGNDKGEGNNTFSSDVNMGGNSNISGGSGSGSGMLHKSLVRNCVSIFRSLAHVSNSNNNSNVNQDLLHDLVQEMTSYFQHESQTWMSEATMSMSMSMNTTTAKTSYNACTLLHHIDDRMKQIRSMTTYYHLTADTVADGIISSTQRKRQNRRLVHLVEEFLLTPHFTPGLLLHPAHLYPILNQEHGYNEGQGHDRGGAGALGKDAKLLFQLSKRYTQNARMAINANPHNVGANTISTSIGMELLRQAFESYGKERGNAIMRPNQSQSTSTPTSTSASTAGPVKPPPQMTLREMNNKIIVNLLEYKAHLIYLYKESFENNVFFGKTVRKVLEGVLNDGGCVDENETESETRRRGRYGNDSDGGKRIAELLAKYMDLRFKNAKSSLVSSPMKGSGIGIFSGSNAGTSGGDNDTEVFQTAVLELFRHIQSKDVFEAFYRQDLAKRLLLNKSSSIDSERSFVSKLMAECGTGYTSKMEGMFKDVELSKDILSSYSAHLSGLENAPNATPISSSSRKVDMEVQVLTTGYWPVHAQYPDLIVPQILLDKREEFDTYYKSKYQGRRIVWQNGLGNCIVRATFPKINGPRELNVSLCQALVLLCFNLDGSCDSNCEEEEIKLDIGQIMKQTGISDRGEAERVLQSLSMGREGTQVLSRIFIGIGIGIGIDSNSDKSPSDSTLPMGTPRKKHKTVRKAVSDSDLFAFNSDFTSNQRRIRITNIQMKETTNDRKKTHESVILDRLHLIDAAIVRIMKARKTMSHVDLSGEVMNQLKFPAKGVDVKKRIESLIEREYMERVEGDSSRYNYLA